MTAKVSKAWKNHAFQFPAEPCETDSLAVNPWKNARGLWHGVLWRGSLEGEGVLLAESKEVLARDGNFIFLPSILLPPPLLLPFLLSSFYLWKSASSVDGFFVAVCVCLLRALAAIGGEVKNG